MNAERYLPHSIDKILKELIGEEPSTWGANLILKLENLLTEEGYDGDEIFSIALPLLKVTLIDWIDKAVDAKEIYDAWIETRVDIARGK